MHNDITDSALLVGLLSMVHMSNAQTAKNASDHLSRSPSSPQADLSMGTTV